MGVREAQVTPIFSGFAKADSGQPPVRPMACFPGMMGRWGKRGLASVAWGSRRLARPKSSQQSMQLEGLPPA